MRAEGGIQSCRSERLTTRPFGACPHDGKAVA